MAELVSALAQVKRIEAAVAAGDLDGANEAAQDLMPLLVSERIEDMLALRERIASLSIEVKSIRDQDATQLKALKQQRGGAQAYRQIQAART